MRILVAPQSSPDVIPVGPPPSPNRKRYPYEGTIDFHGVKILVENRKGSTRRGTGPDGPWSVVMPAHYGEIPTMRGQDGDAVDAFVGPDPGARRVYVVRQHDRDGFPDEDKVLLGFPTRDAAEATYRAAFSGPAPLGDIVTMSWDAFTSWLHDDTNHGTAVQGEPLRGHQELRKALPDLVLGGAQSGAPCVRCGGLGQTRRTQYGAICADCAEDATVKSLAVQPDPRALQLAAVEDVLRKGALDDVDRVGRTVLRPLTPEEWRAYRTQRDTLAGELAKGKGGELTVDSFRPYVGKVVELEPEIGEIRVVEDV